MTENKSVETRQNPLGMAQVGRLLRQFVVPSIVPKLDSKLAFIEISNHRVAIGYTETKLTPAVILVHGITYFKERTGNSGGRYVLGGSFTLYPSIGERSSKETDAFVKDLTDQTRHFCAK